MKFRLTAPNVAFRSDKHPSVERFRRVGLLFRDAGDGFWRCKDVVEAELNLIEDLISLQELTNVLITLDGQTLIFDAP